MSLHLCIHTQQKLKSLCIKILSGHLWTEDKRQFLFLFVSYEFSTKQNKQKTQIQCSDQELNPPANADGSIYKIYLEFDHFLPPPSQHPDQNHYYLLPELYGNSLRNWCSYFCPCPCFSLLSTHQPASSFKNIRQKTLLSAQNSPMASEFSPNKINVHIMV